MPDDPDELVEVQSVVRSLAASRMCAAGEVVAGVLRCQVLGLSGWGSGLPVTLGRSEARNASRMPQGRLMEGSSHRTGTTSPPGQRHRLPGRAESRHGRSGAARAHRRPGSHRGPGRASDHRARLHWPPRHFFFFFFPLLVQHLFSQSIAPFAELHRRAARQARHAEPRLSINSHGYVAERSAPSTSPSRTCRKR